MGRLGADRRWNGRAGHGSRGLIASWPQFGVPAGLFLSNLVILGVSALSGDQFRDLGLARAFVLSIILVGIGLWIRLGILETPVFRQLVGREQIERTPIVEVIRRQPREIILSACCAWPSRRRSTSSPRSSSPTASARCRCRAT